jgi:type IV secretory pathway TrbL component
MADNSSVFNLWLVLVGTTDALFVLVVALLGFHVMSASTFGFDEVEFKHLLPRIGLVFLLVNSSIFAIDGIIELSNAMIRAINATGPTASVWEVLTAVVKQAGGQGVAALLIMIAFLIFAVILLVYYVGRLVTLYLGAVLSPVILLLWLVPGFRDFSESAAKVYLTTVFVLFVHVVILELAASLFAGLVVGSPTHTPDTLMAMVVGLATLIALLKTQGVMMQLSYVSVGPRSARKLGGQFMTGVSYLGTKGKTVVATVNSQKDNMGSRGGNAAKSGKRISSASSSYTQPKSQAGRSNSRTRYEAASSTKPRASSSTKRATKTGETTVAPKPTKPKKMEENP